MKDVSRNTSERTFGQYVILSEDHRAMLDDLRSRRRMSYSETIRRGIEVIANQFSPEIKNSGERLEA